MDFSANELKEKYIYIFEDGTKKLGQEPTEEDLQMVDAGILEVIHASTLTEYYNGSWVDLEEVQ